MFALGLAIVKKLPHWSLSYLGFVLMVGIILSQQYRVWEWIYHYFIQSFGPRSFWSLPIRIILCGDVRAHHGDLVPVERVDPGQSLTVAALYSQCLARHPNELDAAFLYVLRGAGVYYRAYV